MNKLWSQCLCRCARGGGGEFISTFISVFLCPYINEVRGPNRSLEHDSQLSDPDRCNLFLASLQNVCVRSQTARTHTGPGAPLWFCVMCAGEWKDEEETRVQRCLISWYRFYWSVICDLWAELSPVSHRSTDGTEPSQYKHEHMIIILLNSIDWGHRHCLWI